MVEGKGTGQEKKFPRRWLLHAQDSRQMEPLAQRWSAFWGGEDAALRLDAADTTPARFTSEVRSVPMWRDLQVVRLSHAESASSDLVAALLAYLDAPSERSALLVEYAGDLEKRPPAAWRPILKRVDRKNCTPRSAKRMVKEWEEEEGFTVSPRALSALEEWASGDFAKLASALDLLLLYKAEEKTIEAEDLEKLLGAGGSPRVWDLQDAVFKDDRRAVVRLLKGLEGESAVEPLSVVGMLGKQLRALLLLHGHRAGGLADKDISPKALGFSHPYPARKVMAAASRWPEERVRWALGELYRLDLALKGGDPGSGWLSLERSLLSLARGEGAPPGV